MKPEVKRAALCGILAAGTLAGLAVVGSRKLVHFDAALVSYTFATLFAAFGITYRYAMWLQRPPTWMYWKRGWQVFFSPRFLGHNLLALARWLTVELSANGFIFRRGASRGLAHFLIMWGCALAAAITFPLVLGWVHFETVPGQLDSYVTYVFGFSVGQFPLESGVAFFLFHGLVWCSFLVMAGVMLAFRRRMIDHGAASLQQTAQDLLPLLALFAISVTGLMLTVSYSWLKGYGYDFLAILHAVTVILTLLWMPFGKFFHIFQRPAQLGASFYQDASKLGEQAECLRCGAAYTSRMMVRDLITVEKQLGFSYELAGTQGAQHYQQVCPPCRRALFGLAQGALWEQHLTERANEDLARAPRPPPRP